ncbi:nicotinamidase-related amidase [Rhizobium sp. BK313]|uniref:isochorismatase family protein n=1 Tax=Rhizobium sp. BK313 TaxID=2587081 RepID=UPI00105FC5B9|nr:isochorismatase family protein [Rhizobium sp. BK313]MBB3455349.1 nicotinamidase-related amidase [Rhizobium sp. BK313]
MSHADIALLVIDVQESFRQRPYWRTDDLPDFVDRLQVLIDGAKARGIPVVQIFHVDGDEHFSLSSGYVRKLEEIALEADAVFHKSRHSALVGSGLDVWLVENGIRKLIVSGIRTEQCCETTTRHASDLGYEVDYVTEATLTFPMTHASGTVFSADDIKKRTELVLSGRFARIATVEDALAAATTRSAA